MQADTDFMQLALEQARRTQAAGEVPVGAVLVLGRAGHCHRGATVRSAPATRPRTRKSKSCVPGRRRSGSYRLNDTVLYVTLEPCLMCAAAIAHARVRRLVFGAWDPRAGAAGSMLDAFALPGLNHRVDVFGGVLQAEASALLQEFFAHRRA